MSIMTFVGEVHQGKVSVPVADLEGKRVRITLSVEDEAATAPAGEDTSGVVASEEAEILEDCGRIDIPARDIETFTVRFIDIGRIPMRVYSDDDECEVGED